MEHAHHFSCGVEAQHQPPATWIPTEWVTGVAEGWILMSNDEPTEQTWLPSIGNGFVGTVARSTFLSMAGVFNYRAAPEQVGVTLGHTGPGSHRAHVPSAHQISWSVGGTCRSAFGLDTRRGAWLERREGTDWVAQSRLYAHRARRGLLVTEIDVTTSGSRLMLNVSSPQQQPATWLASPDLAFGPVLHSPAGEGSGAFWATTLAGESGSPAWAQDHLPHGFNITSVYSVPQRSYEIDQGSRVLRFVSAHASNLSEADPFSAAVAMFSSAVHAQTLFPSHVAAWDALYDPMQGGGNVTIQTNGQGNVATWLSQVVSASIHALLAAARTDWPHGLSPGGLSTDGYKGHTFWDQVRICGELCWRVRSRGRNHTAEKHLCPIHVPNMCPLLGTPRWYYTSYHGTAVAARARDEPNGQI